jgi:TRAP-type C4-dicarboxylate transport system permease small subunit
MLRLWQFVERAFEALLVLLVTVMSAVCLAQVLWRYLLNDPLIWSEEMSRYLFVWIGYLGAWVAWRRRQHIALDAVIFLRSPHLQLLSARVVEVAVLVFCLYTAWGNVRLMEVSGSQLSAVLQFPMKWVYLAHTVMATLITVDILVGWLTGGRHAAVSAEARLSH